MKSILSLLLLSCSLFVAAQQSASNQIKASYTEHPPEIDGQLNDSIWQHSSVISDFTQRELVMGQPATEKTQVAIAYDDDNLYVAVWCFDSNPEGIIAKELRRDFDESRDDNFILIFDTYNDQRNGFKFITNPNAARKDEQIFNNGGGSNQYWNAVWNVKTSITSEGWFAEFVIPFYSLRYRSGESVQEWGVNFERNIRRKREQVLWQGWRRDNNINQVNQAGQLTGLDLAKGKRFVEIKPYAIGGTELANERKGLYNFGGDVNYLLSPTYRLNLTFNTDFAQVESDQQQINLTRFPLFFPELREFFLEGADYFDMGFGGDRITPFYSRRIGLNQEREAVPIVAGARVLGKENNRTVGLMSLQTAQQDGNPTTNYTSASWRQDVGAQSVVGLMTTNKISNGRWHSTTGVNGRFSTSKFLGNKNLDMGGAVIQSYNTDSGYNPMAFAYRGFLYYLNDKMVTVITSQRSPAPFDAEVGLMRRRNFNENFLLWGFKPRPKKDGPLGFIRQFELVLAKLTLTQYDDSKDIQSFEYGVQPIGFWTRSGETFNVQYYRKAEGLQQPFQLSDDIIIKDSTYWWDEWEVKVRTFEGRTLSTDVQYKFGEFYRGTRKQLNVTFRWRASKYFNVFTQYSYSDIVLPEGELTNNLISTRMEYAINPNAFGSVLTQWNTDQQLLNVNYRLRLIPKLGADFYLILNQLYDSSNGSLLHRQTTVLGKLIWRIMI